MDQNSFLFQAIVFLASAVLFVPLAKRLGLGSVLGYLIAGIVIGPFVIGLVGEEGQDIMHFAEFGVVMMLFMIGLELEPKLLWRLRKTIVGLGGLQIVVTTAIIGGVFLITGFPWRQALVLGMIFSMSSTAIVMQLLREKGLMKTAAGQSAFSVLLFQDIAVIPMLAVFPLLATLRTSGGDTAEHATNTFVDGQPGWIQTLIVIGSVALIIVAGRILIRPLLRIVAKTGIREVFTALSLLIVAGIAGLMTKVGLSPALGAFIAGVVLANSEYRHELESDIEPFKGLLLGLFFIAVGASINFPLIASQPWTVAGWVGVMLLLKTLVLFVLGRLFKLSTEQNFIFSFSLSQIGEFAFVLLSFALQEGALPEQTVNLMIAVVAISMGLTPLMMMLNERLILPRVGTEEIERKPDDVIDEKNPVIISGFGHFGNTIGRFLRANNVQATYLDIDSDTVEVLRKMGFKVFYGDASRHELLEAAGAGEAKIIVIAIDDPERRLELIETVKKHFPHLHILVRATNRYDAYDQMNAGMLHVYRETLDTSLRLGVDALTILGHRAYTARRLARLFLKQDEKNLKKLAAIRNEDEYISESRKLIEEIELIIQTDRQDFASGPDGAWDAESLRQEAKSLDSLAS